MPIQMIVALPAGNALNLILGKLPAGAEYVRVLRRTDQAFAGPSDPNAMVLCDEWTAEAALDRFCLTNGTAYFYQAFYWNGASFAASPIVSATPQASYGDAADDPLSVVRERVELGLAVEVQRGRLKPTSGKVEVLKAPFALPDGVTFPVVSVHLSSDSPAERGISDDLLEPEHQFIGGWESTEGWLSAVDIAVVGVSLNPDERIDLRKALKRIIIVNLPVFAAAGMTHIEFRQSDSEDIESSNAPLFRTDGQFSCLAPSGVTHVIPEIAAVNVTGTAIELESIG